MSLRNSSPSDKTKMKKNHIEGKSSINPDLQIRLESQKDSPKISIIDMFIGDDGAYQLSKFLKDYNHFEFIEIRGNNISGTGFASICEGLKYSQKIKTIAAEWNQIGSDNSGLMSLHDLVKTKPSISLIDLRNNHISIQSAGIIANIIKDCDNLQTFDLRWNDLGDDGARIILGALKTIQRKIQIDLNGNKINEEIVNEISAYDPYREYSSNQSITRSSPKLPKYDSVQTPIDRSYIATEQSSYKPKDSVTRDSSLIKRETDYTPIRGQQSNRGLPPSVQKPSLTTSTLGYTPATKSSNNLTPKSHLKKSGINFNPDIEIKELQHKYESEAREIKEKYEAHIEARLKMGNLIQELEQQLEEQTIRADRAEERAHLLARDLETEKKIREDVEAKCRQLIEELHNKEILIDNIGYENGNLKKDLNQISIDFADFREESAKMENYYNQKLREGEEKYVITVRDLTGENDVIRREIERMKSDFESQLRDIHRENEIRFKKLDDQIRAISHDNTDLTEELRRQGEYIQKLKIEHEEEVKVAAHAARDDEFRKAQAAIRDLDSKFVTLQQANEELIRRNNEMLSDLQDYEKQIRDQQIRYETETTRSRNELDKLRDNLTQLGVVSEKQKNELFAKDNTITRLEKDIENMERDMHRQKAIDHEMIERLKRDIDIEKRKFEESERELTGKISEYERKTKDAQAEFHKVRAEFDRLGEILQSTGSRLLIHGGHEYARPSINSKFNYDS